jgi:molybdenum cofactor guanylyltransferase
VGKETLAEKGRHTKLTSRINGLYTSHEWSIYGLTCDELENFYREICTKNPHLRLAYLDALHNDDLSKNRFIISENGVESVFIDGLKDDSIRKLCTGINGLIINGNHHIGSKQVLIAYDKKRPSIEKRKAELTNPVVIVKYGGNEISQDFFSDIISEEVSEKLPVCEDLEGLKKFLIAEIKIPANLKVLVLAGGKSERMGTDKTLLSYHSAPQWLHLAQLAKSLDLDVYMSCREDQAGLYNEYPVIVDRIVGIGPIGAILSAFLSDPNSAWLVMATDMPNINSNRIQELLTLRDCTKIATTYVQVETQLAEPLFSVYEPRAYPLLLAHLSDGRSCPRQFLKRDDVCKIPTTNAEDFTNVNTPEEFEKWMSSRDSDSEGFR